MHMEPLLVTWINRVLIPVRIGNYIHCKVWDVINNFPFSMAFSHLHWY